MIPEGITTALVHMDAPISFVGEPGRLHIVIEPSVSLIWTATGTPIGNFVDTLALDPGAELRIELPHTDQPGFQDAQGNTYTGWFYSITVVYERNGRRISFPKRDFQILTGQAEVDLALVPAGDAAPEPMVAPILPVTSIKGFTGEVTMVELGLDLVDNTRDADKPISLLAQQALNKKADAAKDANDTVQAITRRWGMVDVVLAKGHMLNLDHHADGAGNAASPGQTYAINIQNRPGAVRAFVGHQYSSVEPFMTLDNTGSKPLIELNNTVNETLNPGSTGTGDFFVTRDQGVALLRLTKDIVFSVGSSKVATFLNTGNKALSVQAASTYDGEAMDVTKAGTGAGTALKVNNSGTGIGLSIAQAGAGQGLRVTATSSTGIYAALIEGADYGPNFTTATNGGTTLNLTKNGTGNGAVLSVVNKGTGSSASFKDSAGAVLSQVAANGEYQHDVAGAGIVLKSPNGQKHRITVADDGALMTTTIA